MHNWRLLILAYLAVLQPIASFTERNLVDGREKCSDRNSVLRDTRLSHGFRINKLPEDRRLNRAETREEQRYEVRRELPLLSGTSADKHLVVFRTEREESRFSPEISARFIRAEIRREIAENRRNRLSLNYDRERHSRDSYRSASDVNRDLLRERDVSRVRFSRESAVRQHDRDVLLPSSYIRETRDENRLSDNMHSERRFSIFMDARRETRRNRGDDKESRIQERGESRELIQRTRNDVARTEISRDRQDRRVVRDGVDERRERVESRLRLNNNRDSRSFDRLAREVVAERQFRSLDRARDFREFRLNVRATLHQRVPAPARREIGNHEERRLYRDDSTQSRDRYSTTRQESRDRTLEDRRKSRELIDRSRSIDGRNVRLGRSETQRNSKVDQRRAQIISPGIRAASETLRVESRRLTDRESRQHDLAERSERQTSDLRSRREVRMDRTVKANGRDLSHNRDRNAINLESDARFRSNTEFFRGKDIFASMRERTQVDGKPAINWQFVFYTLQGIYLCGVLMQMLSQKESNKKPRVFSWLSTPRIPVKVD